jgi:hypothetical protein
LAGRPGKAGVARNEDGLVHMDMSARGFHRPVWVAGLLALALLGAACGRAVAGGVLRAAEVSGDAQYQAAGETAWTVLRPGTALGPGSQVRVPSDGLIRLRSGDDAVELTGGRLRVEGPDKVVLIEGRSLIESGKNAMTIRDNDASLTARISKGVLRYDLGQRIAVYRGEAEVRITQSYPVPQLRELALGTGEPTLRPLNLDPEDRWDLRLLGDALELNRQIEVIGRSLEGIYGAQVRDPAFYEKRVTPPTAVSFLRSGDLALGALLREVEPIDVLAGVVIGLRVAGSAERLAESFRNVIALFRSGASWGVIAAELELPGPEVVAGLEQALTPGAPPQAVQPRPKPKTVVVPPSPGQPRPSPRPTSSPRPTQSPSPSPSPTNSPTPSPSPSPSPTCSPLDQILGNCTGSSQTPPVPG